MAVADDTSRTACTPSCSPRPGRRTGEPRRTCLIYGTSGADEDPAWFKNLQADPSVGVQVGTRRFTDRVIPIVLLTPQD